MKVCQTCGGTQDAPRLLSTDDPIDNDSWRCSDAFHSQSPTTESQTSSQRREATDVSPPRDNRQISPPGDRCPRNARCPTCGDTAARVPPTSSTCFCGRVEFHTAKPAAPAPQPERAESRGDLSRGALLSAIAGVEKEREDLRVKLAEVERARDAAEASYRAMSAYPDKLTAAERRVAQLKTAMLEQEREAGARIAEASAEADRRGREIAAVERRALTCLSCQETFSGVKGLRDHLAQCPRHPAVRRAEDAERDLAALRQREWQDQSMLDENIERRQEAAKLREQLADCGRRLSNTEAVRIRITDDFERMHLRAKKAEAKLAEQEKLNYRTAAHEQERRAEKAEAEREKLKILLDIAHDDFWDNVAVKGGLGPTDAAALRARLDIAEGHLRGADEDLVELEKEVIELQTACWVKDGALRVAYVNISPRANAEDGAYTDDVDSTALMVVHKALAAVAPTDAIRAFCQELFLRWSGTGVVQIDKAGFERTLNEMLK